MLKEVWIRYAEQSIREGGRESFEFYVAEYHRKEERMWDILKERKLWPAVTLVDLNLIADFKPKLGWYPMEIVTSFYHATRDLTIERKRDVTSYLHISEEELPDLIRLVEGFLGEEYCALAKEVRV